MQLHNAVYVPSSLLPVISQETCTAVLLVVRHTRYGLKEVGTDDRDHGFLQTTMRQHLQKLTAETPLLYD